MTIKIHKPVIRYTNSTKLLPFILVITPFFEPQFFERIPEADLFFSIWHATALSAMTAILLLRRLAGTLKKNSFSKYIALYYVSITISTIFNNGDFFAIFLRLINQTVFASFVYFAIQSNTRTTLNSIALLFSVFCFINLVTMIAYPNGLYLSNLTHNKCYFLGHKNQVLYFTLIPFIISVYYTVRDGTRISMRLIVDTAIMVITAILSRSSTGAIVTVGCIFGLVYCSTQKIKLPKLNTYLIVFGLWGITIALIFFQLQYHFAFLIEALLNKSLTLSSRTKVWHLALEEIALSPFFGVGYKTAAETASHILLESPHNSLISSAYYGGVIGIAMYALSILSVAKEINKCVNFRFHQFSQCILACIVVASMVESMDMNRQILLIYIVIASLNSSFYGVEAFRSMGN